MSAPVIFGLISLLFYGLSPVFGDFAPYIEYYLLVYLLIFVCYLFTLYYILSGNSKQIDREILLLLGIGLIARVILIPAEPVLSDDIYRYLWDGRVSASGINPYRYPPADPQLAILHDSGLYSRLTFRQISTIYPPVAQLLFLIGSLTGNGMITWKIVLLLLETGLIFILIQLLKYFRLPVGRILIFALNPLIIIETYHSGHIDMAGLFFLWAAIYLFYIQRPVLSLWSVLAAFLTKFIPLLMFLPFLWRRMWRSLVFLFATSLLIFLPFTAAGTVPMGGLFTYVNRWSFNGFFFEIFCRLYRWIDFRVIELFRLNVNGNLEIYYANAGFYYKILALLIIFIIAVDQVRKLRPTGRFQSISFLKAAYIITAAFLLLIPTLHPWYVMWIIPFLMFTPNFSWLIFTLLIQLSYVVVKGYRLTGVWAPDDLTLFIQYIPFFILLFMEYRDRRSVKGRLSFVRRG